MSKPVFSPNDMKGICLYVLELRGGKYYVGITNNPSTRFHDHRCGRYHPFVKKNLPIKSIYTTLLKTTDRTQTLEIETDKTVELIAKYGIANVCGGVITGDFHERILKFKVHINGMMPLDLNELY